MFDKLEDLVRRFEEITNELTEPSVVNDQNRFSKLMKELPREGTATNAACGIMTSVMVWSLLMPSALQASNCPLGMEVSAARITSEL